MSVELKWKHQQETYKRLEEALEQSGKAGYVFPTGCGKSFVTLKYIENNAGKKILYLCPTQAIKSQFTSYIDQFMLEKGQARIDVLPHFKVMTYAGLLKTEAEKVQADIIILDELHRTGADQWGPQIDKLLEANPNAKVIGMTATPQRTDERDMMFERFRDNIVYEMSLTEALSGEKEGEVVLNGSRYVRVLSQLKDMVDDIGERIELEDDEEKRTKLKQKYIRLKQIVDKADGLEEIFTQSMTEKDGKYIVFCESREQMEEAMKLAQQWFNGVNEQIYIDYVATKGESGELGKTEGQNRKTIEKFNNPPEELKGHLKLMFCIDKLNEGVHLQGISGAIALRPTISPIIFKQQLGRILTSEEGAKETVFIDVANNWLNQMDTYLEIQSAMGFGQRGTKQQKSYDIEGEELELLELLREIGEGLKYKNILDELELWMESHEGEMPRGVGRETEERRKETNLYARWNNSREREIFAKYQGKDLEEIPEEDRNLVRKMRQMGITIKTSLLDEIEEWMKSHHGKMPKGSSEKSKNLTENEIIERRLYSRWINSEEREILIKYGDKRLKEIPEEHRKLVERMWSMGLTVNKKISVLDELEAWMESHGGEMPKTQNKKKQLTKNQLFEKRLYHRWITSEERELLITYGEQELDEIPEEHRGVVEKMRRMGITTTQMAEVKTVLDALEDWMKSHDGKMPTVNNKKKEELTQEQIESKNLRRRWEGCAERKLLIQYEGIDLEKIPEQYRELVKRMKQMGLARRFRESVGPLLEDLNNWMETHEGKMPQNYSQKKENLTKEQLYEKNLRIRWNSSKERQLLKKYQGEELQQIPEEDREVLIRMLNIGIKMDSELESILRKYVAEQVGQNEETRARLEKQLHNESQQVQD